MGVVDYREATEYVLKRFGLCRGFSFRNIVLFVLLISLGFNIASWVLISGNTLSIMANCAFLLGILIGFASICVFDYIALMATAIFTFIASVCAIVTALCLVTDSTDPHKMGTNMEMKPLVAFMFTFAVIETLFTVFLFSMLKNIKTYATSGSIYMNFMDDDDFQYF